jgi:hypothetical protein
MPEDDAGRARSELPRRGVPGYRLDGRVEALGSEEDIGGRRCLDQIHAPPLHVSMYVVVACLLKLLDAATILIILCFATKRERKIARCLFY